MSAQADPSAGIGFNATALTVPAPIADTDPPQPAGFGHLAPDRRPSSPRLAGTDQLTPARIHQPTRSQGLPSRNPTNRTETPASTHRPKNVSLSQTNMAY